MQILVAQLEKRKENMGESEHEQLSYSEVVDQNF